MKDTAASWINDIIYISFKRLSLFDFCNNLYSFLRMYMDISCVGVYSFFDSTITQLLSMNRLPIVNRHKKLFLSPQHFCVRYM